MRKCLHKLLLPIIGMLIGTNAHAYDFEVDGIYYNKNSDGTVAITYKEKVKHQNALGTYYKYVNYDTENFIVPDNVTHEGITYNVTAIGEHAFDGSNLISVELPNGITSIGGYAFRGCSGLTSVTIPNFVTAIGNYAFDGCNGLKTVNFNAENCSGPSTNHIFVECPIEKFIFGDNVKKIPARLLYSCNTLTSVTIPNSVTSIDSYAFASCYGLKTVNFNAENCSDFSSSNHIFWECLIENFVFGDNVKKIPAFILYDCKTLTSVTIGNSVTSIGGSAFYGCSGLTSVNYNAENCSDFQSSTQPFKNSPFENFVFGDNVKRIPAYLLYKCKTLTSVTIPSSVKSIGHYAFQGCTGLYNADVKEIKQVSAKINVKCNILGVKYGIRYSSSYFEPDENGDVNINDLVPNTYYDFTLSIKLPNETFSSLDDLDVKTIGLRPSVRANETTPTTVKLKGSYTEIDATVSGVEFEYSGNGHIEVLGNTACITGLNPNTSYSVDFTVKTDNNYTETTTYTFKTPALTMTTLAAEATSNTVAVIAAETNLSDEETGAGFEWRRYDAPDLVPSSKAPCPVVDGKLMGALNNLSASTYYKYRPYYTSASGQTYYGAWLAFGTADAYVYFEPLVRTYAATNVTSGGASVKAYVVAGSDAITSQGFEYWLSNNTMNRMRAEAAPATGVQTIEATGQWMNATLEGLKESSEYTYRAYVTTAKGTTYGEEQSFTTEKGAGINGIIADEKSEVVEVARYTIDGRMIDEPQRGVNIVRYSDGSVRKVLVK